MTRPATASTSDSAPVSLWRLVLWLALGFGLAKSASLGFTHYVLHRLVHAGRHIVWKAPAGELLLLVLALALGVALQRLVPRTRGRAWLVGLLGAVAGFDFGLNLPGIHPAAAAILGLGFGVQLARFSTRSPDRMNGWIRRTLPALAGVTLAATIVVVASQVRRERRAIAALPAAPSGAPSILLIVLDTQRAMSMSLYGHDRPTTPALERFAAHAVRFDQAYSTAPWTLPSHASIMTGHWAQELSTGWDAPLDRTYPTLAEVLRRRGYLTAGFTANTLNTSPESGLARGFIHYEARQRSLSGAFRSTQLGRILATNERVLALFGRYEEFGRKSAEDVSADFLDWLDHQPDRPFFAFLNYFDAHDPYPSPPPFDSLFGVPPDRDRPDMRQLRVTGWPADEVDTQRRAYEGSIAYVDHQLGLLFDSLAARGRLDRTLVIVTSDHGEEFYEHQLMRHANSLYAPAVHVPLLLRYPARLPSAVSVGAPVSLRDIPATIMDLIGAGADSPFPGRSLLRWVEGTPSDTAPVLSWDDDLDSQPAWYPVHNGPLRSVLIGQHRYLVDANGKEELYSLADPLERHNLAADPAMARLLPHYRVVASTMRRGRGGAR